MAPGFHFFGQLAAPTDRIKKGSSSGDFRGTGSSLGTPDGAGFLVATYAQGRTMPR